MTKAGDRYYNNLSDKTDANIYAKAFYQINTKLGAYVDLQFRNVDFDSDGIFEAQQKAQFGNSYIFFNPKLGLNYKIKPNTYAYISYAIGNKEPARQDFVNSLGLRLPKAEHLQDVEIGLKQKSDNSFVEVDAYFMNYTNQLVITGQINNVGEAIRTNVAKSYRAGLEIQGGIQINNNLKLAANVTISKNKIKKKKRWCILYS